MAVIRLTLMLSHDRGCTPNPAESLTCVFSSRKWSFLRRTLENRRLHQHGCMRRHSQKWVSNLPHGVIEFQEVQTDVDAD